MKNSRRLSEYRIARELGEAVANRLVNACIRDLQRMSNDFSGLDDLSELHNTWDVICVRLQLDLSFHWSPYQQTIDLLIEGRLEGMPLYERDALWLLTEEGNDWDCELEEERDEYPVTSSHLIGYVRSELLNRALYWRNARISRYRARHAAMC